jgi:hypothetical protein
MDVYCLGVSAHFCAVETAADRLQQSGHLQTVSPRRRNGRPVGGFWAALIGAAIIGSAAIGILYDVSLPAAIVFC